MPKFVVVSRARRRRLPPALLPNPVEGQMEEMRRDLAVQLKRMRQLVDQADELRTAIREWIRQSGVAPEVEPR